MAVLSPLCGLADAVDFRAQAKALVGQLTLEEKAALCSGRDMWSTKPIDRLGIPATVLTDGPHGVRRSRANDISSNDPATCFPTAPGLAATWSVDLVHEVGVALGREAQALGVQVLLGPGVNMKRSPLGGRNFEYFSEDPVLTGRLASSWIRGVQSQGVGASLKHFAANNQEWERFISDSVVDERTLREIYLPAFEIAVTEAQPWTVMSAYNKLNGIYASENKRLLTDILRRSWGFAGMVVSDWVAVEDRVAGVRAGLNLEMPSSGGLNDRKIVAAVIAGDLAVSRLDESVTEIVELVLRAKAAAKPETKIDVAEHQALARRAAGEAIVLLKNDRVLPIDPARPGRIAVIGVMAKHPRIQGSGSSRVNPTKIENAYDELATLVGAEHLSYAAGCDIDGNTSDALIAQARETAKAADRAIVFVGLPDSYESEGFDRKNLDLPPDHNRLVDTVAATQPNTTVVLMNGSAVVMPWVGRVKAVLEAYLGGQSGGGAIADVLTGRVNPSGKLAETFPTRIEDTPAYPNFPGRDGAALYGEGLFIGYRHYDARKITPLFPFGFGLSYTTFVYTGIKADAVSVKPAEGATIHIKVKNTGSRAGAEVVQLYVRQSSAPVARPEKELKHFTKLMLAPGEEKIVSFKLSERDFAYYDAKSSEWVVDSDSFEVLVGGSSRDLPLRQVLSVEGLPRAQPKLTRYSSLADLAAHPRGRPIYEQMMQSMLDAATKNTTAPKTPAEEAEAKRARATLEVFMREQTLGKLVMASGGQFSEEMMQGILTAVNQ